MAPSTSIIIRLFVLEARIASCAVGVNTGKWSIDIRSYEPSVRRSLRFGSRKGIVGCVLFAKRWELSLSILHYFWVRENTLNIGHEASGRGRSGVCGNRRWGAYLHRGSLELKIGCWVDDTMMFLNFVNETKVKISRWKCQYPGRYLLQKGPWTQESLDPGVWLSGPGTPYNFPGFGKFQIPEIVVYYKKHVACHTVCHMPPPRYLKEHDWEPSQPTSQKNLTVR